MASAVDVRSLNGRPSSRIPVHEPALKLLSDRVLRSPFVACVSALILPSGPRQMRSRKYRRATIKC